jgi:hypothetical protein
VRRNSVGELEGDGFGIVQDIRNLATINAEGIDYSLSYDFDVGDFDIGLGIAGTHTLDSSFQSSPASSLIECQGVYGDTCGNPTSEDRINLSASVGWKSLSATVFVRHLSAVDVQERADDPDQTGRSIYLVEKIPAVQYVDLAAVALERRPQGHPRRAEPARRRTDHRGQHPGCQHGAQHLCRHLRPAGPQVQPRRDVQVLTALTA